MSDAQTIAEPLLTALNRRAGALARLLESHPGLHLLAEYEAAFLDHPLCVDRPEYGNAANASDLLTRMDAAIAALEHGVEA